MTIDEIIKNLTELKKKIEFFEQRKSDKRRVAKKIYSQSNLDLFMQGLEEQYGNILPRPYWDKIDCLIKKLKDPDLAELGAFPLKKEFLSNL